MRYLTLAEVINLYVLVIEQSGGSPGIRDISLLKSALANPRMTYAGKELYPNLIDKASILGYSIIENHPFVDGNKRIGHAAMEAFLVMNGFEIDASVDEQEQTILHVASGQMSLDDFREWLSTHIRKID